MQCKVVSEYGLDEYLKVVDAYLDIVLQNQMVSVEVLFALSLLGLSFLSCTNEES